MYRPPLATHRVVGSRQEARVYFLAFSLSGLVPPLTARMAACVPRVARGMCPFSTQPGDLREQVLYGVEGRRVVPIGTPGHAVERLAWPVFREWNVNHFPERLDRRAAAHGNRSRVADPFRRDGCDQC